MNGNGRAAVLAAVVALRVMGAAATEVPVAAVMMTIAVIHVIRSFDQRKRGSENTLFLTMMLSYFSLGVGGGRGMSTSYI